jgi:hypothetical protein
MRDFKMAIVGLVFTAGFMLGACGGDNSATTGEDSGADGTAASSSGGSGSSSGSSSGASSGSSSGGSSGSSSGGSSSSGSSSGGSSGGDAGDGGAPDFSVFVKGLIANDTSNATIPVPLPADGAYSDNQSLADYPASFF